MKISSVLFISGALVSALGGTFVVRGLITPVPKKVVQHAVLPVKPAPVYVPVLAASRDIQPGEFLDGGAIQWQPVQRDYSADLYIRKDSIPLADNYGATVRQPVKKGQLLTYNMVVRSGEPGFLAAVLKPGMRAIAIPTSALGSQSGLVQAGDHVDVILGPNSVKKSSHNKSSSAESTQSYLPLLAAQTLLTDVRVLALNSQTRSELQLRSDKPQKQDKAAFYETATLEVTPEQAQKLALARELGTLQLALRSVQDVLPDTQQNIQTAANDKVTTTLQVTDINQVLTHMSTDVPAPTVTTYRGETQAQVTTDY